jgi:hypothetical protein
MGGFSRGPAWRAFAIATKNVDHATKRAGDLPAGLGWLILRELRRHPFGVLRSIAQQIRLRLQAERRRRS